MAPHKGVAKILVYFTDKTKTAQLSSTGGRYRVDWAAGEIEE